MAESNIIIYVPPTLFSIVAAAFLVLWQLKVIPTWQWSAGFAQTALGFVLSTFSVQPMFDAFCSGMIFIGAAYCYGSGLISHFSTTRVALMRRLIIAIYTPTLVYLVFVEQSLVWHLFLTDAFFALLLGVAVLAVFKKASRPVDVALLIASIVVVLDSVLRTAFFTFFTNSSDDLGDFANSAYNLAVHVSTITVCMIFPFTALGAIASAAIDRHREDAESDPLTKLLNRRGFEKAIERDFGAGNPTGSVLVFDIDHFKRINDNYGHACGDRVIRVLADVLRETVGGRGYVARAGGEEFVALLPATSNNEGEALANLVRKVFKCFEWEAIGLQSSVTLSCGVSQLRSEPQNLVAGFIRADSALYTAKTSGRNKVCLARESIEAAIEEESSTVLPFEKVKDVA